MDRFNAEKATALGIGDLAPVGRRRKRKKEDKVSGKSQTGKLQGRARTQARPKFYPQLPAQWVRLPECSCHSKVALWFCKNFP